MSHKVVVFIALVVLVFSGNAAPLPLCRTTEVCLPPATFVFTDSPPPFNAPVRFGGEVTKQGEVRWLWVRIDAPSLPCTHQQATDRNAYQTACAASIGDVLMDSGRFRYPD